VPEPGLTVTLGWAKDAVSPANAPEQVAIIMRAAASSSCFVVGVEHVGEEAINLGYLRCRAVNLGSAWRS
jgi:hypothetical protein